MVAPQRLCLAQLAQLEAAYVRCISLWWELGRSLALAGGVV
jgi:hypothetical protein